MVQIKLIDFIANEEVRSLLEKEVSFVCWSKLKSYFWPKVKSELSGWISAYFCQRKILILKLKKLIESNCFVIINISFSFSDERFDCPLEFPDPQKTGQFSLLGLSTQMGASLHFCDVHQNEIPSLHFQQKMAR